VVFSLGSVIQAFLRPRRFFVQFSYEISGLGSFTE